jgi:hypothetical protein
MFDRTHDPDVDVGPTFYRNVDTWSCIDAGLRVEKKTRDWWKNQSEEARAALEIDKTTIEVAVRDFHGWLANNLGGPDACVWSQGASFDVPIWEAAAAAVDLIPPWKFWCVRDTRTAYDLAGYDHRGAERGRAGTAHNALDDARHQARCVREALTKLKKLPKF